VNCLRFIFLKLSNKFLAPFGAFVRRLRKTCCAGAAVFCLRYIDVGRKGWKTRN
jgi:hypothetical protein